MTHHIYIQIDYQKYVCIVLLIHFYFLLTIFFFHLFFNSWMLLFWKVAVSSQSELVNSLLLTEEFERLIHICFFAFCSCSFLKHNHCFFSLYHSVKRKLLYPNHMGSYTSLSHISNLLKVAISIWACHLKVIYYSYSSNSETFQL